MRNIFSKLRDWNFFISNVFFFYFECKNTWAKRLKKLKKKKNLQKRAHLKSLHHAIFITIYYISPLNKTTSFAYIYFFFDIKKKTRIHSRIINVNVERFVNYSHPLNSFLKKLKIFLAISK